MVRLVASLVFVVFMAICGRAETPTPEFVLELANAHIATLPSKPKDVEREKRLFCSLFLLGYTKYVHIDESLPIDLAGINAGVRYRNEHKDSMHRVLNAFQYRLVVRKGVCRVGFEMSQFENSDVEKPGWWLSMLHGCEQENLRWQPSSKPKSMVSMPEKFRKTIDDNRGKEAKVQVTGYLSPIGTYGHLNAHKREFLATRIESSGSLSAREADKQEWVDDGYRTYDEQPHATERTNEPGVGPKPR